MKSKLQKNWSKEQIETTITRRKHVLVQLALAAEYVQKEAKEKVA